MLQGPMQLRMRLWWDAFAEPASLLSATAEFYNPLLPHTTSDSENENITIKAPHATLVRSSGTESAAANAGVAKAITEADAAANMARCLMATSLSGLSWAEHLTGDI
jgi:hypothetical protein